MFISVVIFGLIILVRQSAALVTVSLFVRCLFVFFRFLGFFCYGRISILCIKVHNNFKSIHMYDKGHLLTFDLTAF